MMKRNKSLYYLMSAIIVGVILFLFHNKIADALLYFHSNGAPSGPVKYVQIVVYGGIGGVLFLLLCSIEFYIASAIENKPIQVRYIQLFFQITQCIIVFVFGDLVFQNFRGINVSLNNLTMSYQSIGGMVAVLLCILSTFYIQSINSSINFKRMPISLSNKNTLLFLFSIASFLLSTLFLGQTAHLLLRWTAPKIDGNPVLFSPYNLISYYNLALYAGLAISGILFFMAVEPTVFKYLNKSRIISIPVAVLITSVYYLVIYYCSTMLNWLFYRWV